MSIASEIILHEKRKVFKIKLIEQHIIQEAMYEEGISICKDHGFRFKTLYNRAIKSLEEKEEVLKLLNYYSSVKGLNALIENKYISKVISAEYACERKILTEYSEIVIGCTNTNQISPVFSYGITDRELTVNEMAIHMDSFTKFIQEKKIYKVMDSGKYNVLMFPEVMSVLVHEIIGHLCEADNHINNQLSKYQVGYDFGVPITVYDDPQIPNSWGGIPFDDEGNESKKVVLVDRGKISDFMTSNGSSEILGLEKNGHARCIKYNKKPIDRMTNTIMQSGEECFESMIQEFGNGIIAKMTTGGFMYKDFYGITIVDGLYIKNGHMSRITNCLIRGRIGDVINHITRISSKTEVMSGRGCVKRGQGILPVSVEAPYVLFESLFVEQK